MCTGDDDGDDEDESQSLPLLKKEKERERENRKVSIRSIPSAIIFPKSDAVARMPELIGFFDFLFSRERVLRKISFLSFSMDLIENKFFYFFFSFFSQFSQVWSLGGEIYKLTC